LQLSDSRLTKDGDNPSLKGTQQSNARVNREDALTRLKALILGSGAVQKAASDKTVSPSKEGDGPKETERSKLKDSRRSNWWIRILRTCEQ